MSSSPSSAKDSPGHESNVSRSSLPSGLPESSTSLYRDPSFASLGTSSSSGQDEFFSCLDHSENALKQMETYYRNQQLCDVVLIAGTDGKRWV